MWQRVLTEREKYAAKTRNYFTEEKWEKVAKIPDILLSKEDEMAAQTNNVFC